MSLGRAARFSLGPEAPAENRRMTGGSGCQIDIPQG